MDSKEEILERLRKMAEGVTVDVAGDISKTSGEGAQCRGEAHGGDEVCRGEAPVTGTPAMERGTGAAAFHRRGRGRTGGFGEQGLAGAGAFGQSLTEAARESEFRDAMNRAVRLLAGRNHTKAELVRKLRQRKIGEKLVDAVIRECERLKYIDDRVTAGYLLWELKRRGYGSERIRSEMARKGLDSALVDELVAERIDPEEELENAFRMFDKKRRTFLRETDVRKRRDKIYRYLYSRGFSSSTITEVIDAQDDVHDEFY